MSILQLEKLIKNLMKLLFTFSKSVRQLSGQKKSDSMFKIYHLMEIPLWPFTILVSKYYLFVYLYKMSWRVSTMLSYQSKPLINA